MFVWKHAYKRRLYGCLRGLVPSLVIVLLGLTGPVWAAAPARFIDPVKTDIGSPDENTLAETISIAISAGSLKQALVRVSIQTGIQFIYEDRLLAGKTVSALVATETVGDFIQRLLRPSGLGFVVINAVTINVVQLKIPKPQLTKSYGQIEEVSVTGTRIKRSVYSFSRPVISLGRDLIEVRSFQTAAGAVEQTPGIFLGTDTQISSQSTGNIGQSFPNVFGYGTNRTLVLVNGRRSVSQNLVNQFSQQRLAIGALVLDRAARINSVAPGDQVDLNSISSGLIERIEVIFTGGTTTYGSGALAGTVNVVLKDDFEGLELLAQQGISGLGDAANRRFQATWGNNFDAKSGNITFSIDYSEENGLYIDQRIERLQGASLCPFGPVTTGGNGLRETIPCFDAITAASIPNTGLITRRRNALASSVRPEDRLVNSDGELLLLSASGGLLTFTDAGVVQLFSGGTLGGSDIALATGARAGENDLFTFDVSRFPRLGTELVTPQRRFIAQVIGHKNFANGKHIFYEASYVRMRSLSDNRLPSSSSASQAFFGEQGGSFDRPELEINIFENPFVSDELLASLIENEFFDPTAGPNQTFFLSRSNVDILGGRGRGRNSSTDAIFRSVLGFGGTFSVGQTPFDWEFSYSYGQSNATLLEEDIDGIRLELAVDAVLDPASGDIVCRAFLDRPTVASNGSALSAADINDCVPINVLGFNQFDPSARNYLLRENISKSRQRQGIFELNFETTLAELPAGPVGFAFGFHRRRESGVFRAVQQEFQNAGLGSAIAPVDAHFTNREIYAEILVPLVTEAGEGEDQGFIREWSVDGAVRFIDHSDTGSDYSFTVGSRMALSLPIIGNAVSFRGHYSEAIRAPAIAEFTPSGVDFRPVFSEGDVCNSVDAATVENCEAEVARLQARGTLPDDFSLSSFDGSVIRLRIFRQNPNLENEKSRAVSAGVIFEPEFVPGLQMSADWTSLKLFGGIESAIAANSCFSRAGPRRDICNLVERDPSTFLLANTLITFDNVLNRSSQSVSFSARYRFDAAAISSGLVGDFIIAGSYFNLLKDTQRRLDGREPNNLSVIPIKVRSNASLTYEFEQFTAFLQWQRTGAFKAPNELPSTLTREGSLFFSLLQFSAPSTNIFNSSFRYRYSDRLSLLLTVNDIFDDRGDSPRTQIGSVIQNPVGRSFSVSLRAGF